MNTKSKTGGEKAKARPILLDGPNALRGRDLVFFRDARTRLRVENELVCSRLVVKVKHVV